MVYSAADSTGTGRHSFTTWFNADFSEGKTEGAQAAVRMVFAARNLCPLQCAPLLNYQLSQACRARGSCGSNHVEPGGGKLLDVPHMCDVVASQVLAAPAGG